MINQEATIRRLAICARCDALHKTPDGMQICTEAHQSVEGMIVQEEARCPLAKWGEDKIIRAVVPIPETLRNKESWALYMDFYRETCEAFGAFCRFITFGDMPFEFQTYSAKNRAVSHGGSLHSFPASRDVKHFLLKPGGDIALWELPGLIGRETWLHVGMDNGTGYEDLLDQTYEYQTVDIKTATDYPLWGAVALGIALHHIHTNK